MVIKNYIIHFNQNSSLLQLISKFPQLCIIRVESFLVRFLPNVIIEKSRTNAVILLNKVHWIVLTVQRIWTEMVLCTGRNLLINGKNAECDPWLLF